jgi:hypothetical protein
MWKDIVTNRVQNSDLSWKNLLDQWKAQIAE